MDQSRLDQLTKWIEGQSCHGCGSALAGRYLRFGFCPDCAEDRLETCIGCGEEWPEGARCPYCQG